MLFSIHYSAAAKVGFSTWCFSVGPIWAHVGPCGPMWAHMGPYGSMRAHTGPYRPHAKTPCTKTHLSSSRIILTIFRIIMYSPFTHPTRRSFVHQVSISIIYIGRLILCFGFNLLLFLLHTNLSSDVNISIFPGLKNQFVTSLGSGNGGS